MTLLLPAPGGSRAIAAMQQLCAQSRAGGIHARGPGACSQQRRVWHKLPRCLKLAAMLPSSPQPRPGARYGTHLCCDAAPGHGCAITATTAPSLQMGSPLLAPAVTPAARAVHVLWGFTGEVDWPRAMDGWLRDLPPDEAQSVLQCAGGAGGVEGRTRLLARVMQRTAVASALPHSAAPTSCLTFERNAHGKPFLIHHTAQLGHARMKNFSSSQHQCVWAADLGPSAWPPPVQFNVTHTAGVAGVVVAPGGWAVGLDVERVGRVPRAGVLRLAHRRFAPAEVAALEACGDDASRATLFSALWAAKEAFVKARGTGISAPPGLRGFSVGFEGGWPPPTRRSGPMRLSLDLGWHSVSSCGPSCSCLGGPTHCPQAPSYQLLLFYPSPHHVAALCVALPRTEAHMWPPAALATEKGAAQEVAECADRAGLNMWRFTADGSYEPLCMRASLHGSAALDPGTVTLTACSGLG